MSTTVSMTCSKCGFPEPAHCRPDRRCPAKEPGWLGTTFTTAIPRQCGICGAFIKDGSAGECVGCGTEWEA